MANISIFVGTVNGHAHELAEEAKHMLEQKGHSAEVVLGGHLDQLKQAQTVLVICSTTGQGDFPPEIEPLYYSMDAQMPPLFDKPFAVIAMGDSGYGDTYCNAGKQFDFILEQCKGRRVLPRLDIDAGEYFDATEPGLQWLEGFAGRL